MHYPRIYICLILAICLWNRGFTQSRDTALTGFARGIVRDSSRNYVLISATLAVYRSSDSGLISYQLSNNFGEFRFEKLPAGIPLNIVASYTGYVTLSTQFIIPPNTHNIDLKYLSLKPKYLDEIVVTGRKPPVRMNGDTLEFNADAFKLDSSAVVEDLLRKLPGIVLWGDGTITVNGRAVRNVFVNGKPFFGADSRVATQNLPSSAVEKIQVYRENNDNNPIDSILNVNIQLKKNKQTGSFGKLSYGQGTDSKMNADGMISLYTPRTQLSLMAAGNNINKIAGSVTTLMRNASFKGISAQPDYQSNFSMQGINTFRAAGLTFHHDFDEKNTSENKNSLDAEWLSTDNKKTLLKTTRTVISTGNDSSIIQDNHTSDYTDDLVHTAKARYDWIRDKTSFYVAPDATISESHQGLGSDARSTSAHDQLMSQGSSHDNIGLQQNTFGLSAGFKHDKNWNDRVRWPQLMDADYNFTFKTRDIDETRNSTLLTAAGGAGGENFSRKYDAHSQQGMHTFDLAIRDLKHVLFGNMSLAGINLELQNQIQVLSRNERQFVEDLDSLRGKYIENTYLTNRSVNYTLRYRSGFNLKKTVSRELANRYQQAWQFKFSMQSRLFTLHNTSEKAFQNLKRSYGDLVPSAGISFTDKKFGRHQLTLDIEYSTPVEYPAVDQLAPLVDSSSIYYLNMGNPQIKPMHLQELDLTLMNNSFRSKNTLSYNIDISIGASDSYIGDSSLYDELGRTRHYFTNIKGYKYANTSLTLKKSYKFHQHQFQPAITSVLRLSTVPLYIDKTFGQSRTLLTSHELALYYTYEDFLALNLSADLSYYRASQKNTGYILSNLNQTNRLSASINLTKHLGINSNISYSSNTASGSNTVCYTILNASLSYRFLHDNKAEARLSALDLLRQNTGIVNYATANSLTAGTANVLRQYFMVSLAWFPRRFGAKSSECKP